ncbi:GTPase IMAP family member 7-like [Silurus asotus]|uniref:GTPase IMAP family member 7-like n=1 Tax=Silurus asotus TaxID=30991 RepID=A0AAD5AR80_SILAS|nr:GTPase IMAP family member 7-like [Silurus asotus]
MAAVEVCIMAFGSSGDQQFSLTESILQKAVFTGAEPNDILTTKTCGNVCERNVTLVNTPNLDNHKILHYMLKKELKKAICFSCPGPHAVLFVLNASEVPQNVFDIFKPVVQYFGEHILNHTIIILYHEEKTLSLPLEEIVKKNKQLMELLKKCGHRYLVFDGKKNRKEGTGTRKLFEEIDKMVEKHGIFSNREFEDADKRIRIEEKMLQDKRKREVRVMREELEQKYSAEKEDLEKEMRIYEEKIRLENREKAEVQVADRLGVTLRLVDYMAAVGKGAVAGAVIAKVLGFPGMAIGAGVGAAFGGLLGGAAGAVLNIINDAWGNFRRGAT